MTTLIIKTIMVIMTLLAIETNIYSYYDRLGH